MAYASKYSRMRRLEDIALNASAEVHTPERLSDFKRERWYSKENPFESSYLLNCLDNTLDKVRLAVKTRGKYGITRLINSMPRRHRKSTTVGALVAQTLELHPETRVLVVTSDERLGRLISTIVRRFVRMPLAKDTHGKLSWNIAGHEGGVVVRTAGQGATGYGYDLLICDDLVPNRAFAESPTKLDTLWNELNDSIFNAANFANAPRIVIGTRFSVEDPIGRLLINEPDEWVNFKIPAMVDDYYCVKDHEGEIIYERYPNTPLDETKFSLEQLREIEHKTPPYSWQSLWQQEPRESEGGEFKREWFRIIDNRSLPEMKRMLRGWDLAMTEKEGADWTCGVRMGLGVDDNWYVTDCIRRRVDFGKLPQLISDTAKSDGRAVKQIYEEAGVMPRVIKDLVNHPDLHNHTILGQPVKDKKLVRAMPLQMRLSEGKVFLQRGGWNDSYIDEFCAFQRDMKHKHDDQVDATSLAYNALYKPAYTGYGVSHENTDY